MLPQAQETGRSVPCCYPCVPWHRRARFQHRIVSAMSSCCQPPHFIFSWYRVHTQIPPSPPRPPPPHRALPLRGRPIARDPGTGGPGFSIASPRPCCKSEQLKMARPSGASFSPKKASLPVTPPSHTSPPRRSAPTAAARSRQTRIRFQDCIASGMPSCSSAQHGTSVGGQLQPQKCTHSPNRHVYEISSVPWLSNADCECKSVSWNKVSLSSQAGHPGSRMPGSDCIIDFGFRVITLKSHRRAGLRRPTAAARSRRTRIWF